MKELLFILLLLLLIYIPIRIYRKSRGQTIHRHSHCCDACKVKDKCDQYRMKKGF